MPASAHKFIRRVCLCIAYVMHVCIDRESEGERERVCVCEREREGEKERERERERKSMPDASAVHTSYFF